MGIDYSTYIGPYAECKITKHKVEQRVRSCTNANCKNHKKEMWRSKFCKDCGSAIGAVETDPIEESTVDTWKLREKMDEAMTTPIGDSFHDLMKENETDIWYGNRHDDVGISFDPKNEVRLEEILAATPAKEMVAFEKFYAKELNMLKEAYGKKNVTIKWGLIHQIS